MNVKFVVICIVAIGLALILGRWHQQERIKNRFAGKPWYMDFLNLPSLVILAILTALVVLRCYVATHGEFVF